MKIINMAILLLVFPAGLLSSLNAQYIGDNRPWSGVESRDSLAARVDTASFRIVTSIVDSLAEASETWDMLLNTRVDSVRDNSTVGSGDAEYVWIDTTQYDFLLVDDSDTTSYEFIRKFSGTFVVGSDTTGNSNGVTFESLLIETQRLGKAAVNIACSFDTLFFTDTTFFDTTFTNTVKFYGINRPGSIACKSVFYKLLDHGQYANSIQMDSVFSVPQMVSTGRIVFENLAFHAPVNYNAHLNGGIIGTMYYANVMYTYDDCFLHGQCVSFRDMKSTHPNPDSLSLFVDCVFDTVSTCNYGTAPTIIKNCSGTVGNMYWEGSGIRVWITSCTFYAHEFESWLTSFWVADCNLYQLFDNSYITSNNSYVYGCRIVGRATHTVSYIGGFRSGNNTYQYLGQEGQMVHGSTFNTCTIGVYGADYVLNNSFIECTTALSNIAGAYVYNNAGLLNSTWATGTPTDSAGNHFDH